jgi:arylsulfatase A-like enzyme
LHHLTIRYRDAMKFSMLLVLVLAISSPSFAAEWVNLFNGKNTEGWTPREEVETFEAIDGEIHLLATKNVWVTSQLQMDNFEASVEVLLPEDAKEAGLNTGFSFRILGEEGKPKGYQIEIEGDVPGENGGVYAIGMGGWLYPKKEEQKDFLGKIDGVIQEGQWNTYRVVCDGPSITTFVNDVRIAQVTDAQSLNGYFGIQHHGKGGTIRFRNIKARELPAPSPEANATEAFPNILWLTAEDMSPTLGCYGDEYATTPNLDQFAKESVRYTNAFAASPVCSPSRSTLITGIWAPSSGTHQMRSAFPLPDNVTGYSAYLRKAGYYATNNVKTDYNTGSIARLIKESWNENSDAAHWNSKERGQRPFFAVFNHMTSHQSRTAVWPHRAFEQHVQSLISEDLFHNPDTAPIPPYYPNTPIVRKTLARYYDCVTAMDQQIGDRLKELEDEGVADNTIVFFYSDHGSGMPRHKRLLTDSGMHVPLMIRFPERWQHLAPAKPGESIGRLVTFVDFPATLLSMVGLEVPTYMQGSVFIGPEADEAPEYLYGFRDRVDEVFDMARSVRSKQYLYIRNYMPHLSWNPPSVFSDLADIRRNITRHADENSETLSMAQRHYTNATRAAEEFYDISSDPENINNLMLTGMSNKQKKALNAHRAELIRKRMEIKDNGALPEAIMAQYIEDEGVDILTINNGGSNHRPDLESAWAAADLVGSTSREQLLTLARSGDPSSRYWSIIGLRYAFPEDQDLLEDLYDYMDDYIAPVRIEMSSWMAAESEKHRAVALQVLARELDNEKWWTALRACRAIELLGEKARPLLPLMQKRYNETRNESGDNNFFIAFSSGAFLDKMGGDTKPWDFSPAAGSFSADPEEEE